MTEEIVRSPEAIQRTGFLRVESQPWLPLPAPMEEAHRTRMEVSAESLEIVATEAVLVPPVLDSLYVAGEHQEKRRKRAELVDSVPLLDFHPVLELLRELPLPPFPEIDHHYAGVEVARSAASKRRREDPIGPELGREVASEVRMAVLRRAEHVALEIDPPELGHVVDDDEIGVEVDYAADAGGEEIREVDPGVVERLVQGSPDGVGDFAEDEVGIEVVDVELEVRERSRDDAAEIGSATAVGDEVEDDVLGAGGVLEDGEHAGDGAAEVRRVERHRDVDYRRVVRVLLLRRRRPRRPRTFPPVPKCRCLAKLRQISRHR